jgi:hypothetical protein
MSVLSAELSFGERAKSRWSLTRSHPEDVEAAKADRSLANKDAAAKTNDL